MPLAQRSEFAAVLTSVRMSYAMKLAVPAKKAARFRV